MSGFSDIKGKVRFLTQMHRAFEQRQRLVQVPFVQIAHGHITIGSHQAEGVIDRLSKPHPGFADGNPLGKCPHLEKIYGQVTTNEHGGKAVKTKALVELLALQRGHSLPAGGYRLRQVPLLAVQLTQVAMRLDVRTDIPTGGGQGEGALASFETAVLLASL